MAGEADEGLLVELDVPLLDAIVIEEKDTMPEVFFDDLSLVGNDTLKVDDQGIVELRIVSKEMGHVVMDDVVEALQLVLEFLFD
ncbi:hypothetical protein KK062_27605 [Fulvivirgaceae bacterium PWU5]|uniref:Uncharacterized protein n=1 Tax=Dawidia cretensis TaxID=2782350 RepID=A0AAP2E4F8_9BACT|nr:hypothetical protein [Dawidia cretensis]MBT1712038.1 hypothetical protein [Dawidia cretensis]